VKGKIISNLDYTQYLIIDALEDVKGQNILIFDTSQKSNFFDRVIIASGVSNRQTRALAKSVVDKLKKEKGINCFLEGEDNGEWVLVDCGDIICHVMQPIIREYYNLEEIWGFKSIPLGKIKDSFQEK
jgi:ribosome-associated protein|tara:strand:+ start:218 stop:601 length:384 start_codon:yes stop_codon:yes gene_type:complete